MIQHSTTITKLMGAMLKVQAVVDVVRTDSKNPAFKASYASLEAVVDAIRPARIEAGLVVMQAPGEFRDGTISVETMISHAESGEWIKSETRLPVQKQDAQGAGSAITYAERYSLMALFNLPPVDDDGNDAGRRFDPPRPQIVEQPAPAASTSADDHAEAMGATIRKCGSLDALEALRVDPGFVRQFKSLPLGQQAIVGDVIKKKRQQFGEAA